MNAFLQLPWSTRLAVIYVIGLAAAALVNWGIYQLSFFHQHLGPWSRSKNRPQDLRWTDRVPLVGWWRLQRHSKTWGSNVWLRPWLIEFFLPLFFVWLYWFEATGGLLPRDRAVAGLLPALQPAIHVGFIAHFLLINLMMVATFIDFDEQLIPDWVTVPGTLIGLIGSAFFSGWLLPVVLRPPQGPFIGELHAAHPYDWPPWLDGNEGLLVALACFTGWCLSLTDRRWITRRGWKKAFVYFFARLLRSWQWQAIVFAVWIVGAAMIYWAFTQQIQRWPALESSLIGMAISGGIVWSVRIVASNALGVEALGFGDVTLMAMIGAFIGWQPSLLVFFFAPMCAVLIVLIAWLLTGERAFPYGPYLCFAALLVILGWDRVWNQWAEQLFLLGSVLVAILLVALVLLGVILGLWRWIRDRFLFGDE